VLSDSGQVTVPWPSPIGVSDGAAVEDEDSVDVEIEVVVEEDEVRIEVVVEAAPAEAVVVGEALSEAVSVVCARGQNGIPPFVARRSLCATNCATNHSSNHQQGYYPENGEGDGPPHPTYPPSRLHLCIVFLLGRIYRFFFGLMPQVHLRRVVGTIVRDLEARVRFASLSWPDGRRHHG
jgi:hypothetical protein